MVLKAEGDEALMDVGDRGGEALMGDALQKRSCGWMEEDGDFRGE